MSEPRNVSADDFKAALSRWASGVTIVTAEGPVGMTVSAFSSLSLDPPLVIAAIAKDAICHDAILAADGFAVHMLDEDQTELSTRFAGPSDRFADLEWAPGHFGAPLLHGGIARLVCARHAVAEGGDHTILVGRVVQVDARSGRPLIYFRGAYRGLTTDGDG